MNSSDESQFDQPRVSKLLHQFAILHCWLQHWLNVSNRKDRDTNSFIFLLTRSTVKVHNIYEIISTNITPRSHHSRIKKQENHKNFTLFRPNFGPIENTTFSFVMVFRIQSMVSWVFPFFFFHSYFIPTHEASWLIVDSFIKLAYLAIAIQCSRKDLLACSVIQFKSFLTKLFCGQKLYIATEGKTVLFFLSFLFPFFFKFVFIFLIRIICRSIRLAYIL